MKTKTLSQDAVRGLMLAAQGLHQSKPSPTSKAAVRRMIRQMHVLQIDTIHVVARSPYLVLWSRLGDYDPRWLEDLLAEGKLFEYWSHAACFLPIEDYALYRRMMQKRQDDETGWQRWMDDHADLVNKLMTHIRENGAVRSADFERTDGVVGNWWNWKDEKTALEGLWTLGDLMITKRHNFQRVYDLRERVLPSWDDNDVPEAEAVHKAFVLNTVQALGVTKAAWIADYFRMYKRDALMALDKLVKQGLVETIPVEGWKEPGYFHTEQRKAVESALKGKIPVSKTTLLSPFDPLVWDRARALNLFSFDYKIEVYTPALKRKYGYFTLPILHNNAIIGRLDPKAHRKDGIFEVKAVHLEPGVIVDDTMIISLKQALQACAAWHKTPQVIIRAASQPGLAERLSD